jgi:uncharacterized protein (DUF302 family)
MITLKPAVLIVSALLSFVPFLAHAADPAPPPPSSSGVIRVKSDYAMDETLSRIKKDIQTKGIRFFDEIDQAQLGAGAGIKLHPSVLILFGNPPLGVQFLTASPYAGLDWPVRMLVFQDDADQVWIAYTDFAYIGKRHHLKDRDAQLKMASEVAASIASSAQSAPHP